MLSINMLALGVIMLVAVSSFADSSSSGSNSSEEEHIGSSSDSSSISGSSSTEEEHIGSDDMWSQFKKTRGKTYENIAEDNKRRSIWESNLKKIKEHNERAARGEFTYTLGETVFADLTPEEFKEKYLTEFGDPPKDHYSDPPKGEEIPEHALPSVVDWKSRMTPIKNQGSCGSCYTFSTAATIEGYVAIKGGGLTSLSTQQILDCTGSGTYGCSGGWPRSVYSYLKYKGIMTWASYPYRGYKSSCLYSSSKITKARIGGYGIISSELSLMSALYHGPVSVCVDATHFSLYHSGVYNGACTTTINHAVVAVGFAVDHYIIKNSWGTGWGEQGYMRLARKGTNFCGITSYAEYPIVTLS